MQSNKKSTRGVATREVLRSNDTAKRSAEIVVAARELYEEKGLARTSIQDITNHVGVTRSLFYHYFQNKEEVTSAVLDQYITDFLEAMQHWHESQTALATDESLHSMVKIMRMVLFEKNTFRMALSTQENAALYLDFLNRFAAQGAEFMVTHPMVEQTKYGEQSDHLYETFYVLIVGLVSYLRSHPDVEDEVLIDVVTRMLNIEQAEEAASSPNSGFRTASGWKVGDLAKLLWRSSRPDPASRRRCAAVWRIGYDLRAAPPIGYHLTRKVTGPPA